MHNLVSKDTVPSLKDKIPCCKMLLSLLLTLTAPGIMSCLLVLREVFGKRTVYPAKWKGMFIYGFCIYFFAFVYF